MRTLFVVFLVFSSAFGWGVSVDDLRASLCSGDNTKQVENAPISQCQPRCEKECKCSYIRATVCLSFALQIQHCQSVKQMNRRQSQMDAFVNLAIFVNWLLITAYHLKIASPRPLLKKIIIIKED